MEFTKEVHDALLNYIKGIENKVDLIHTTQITLVENQSKINNFQDTLNDNLNSRIEDINKAMNTVTSILERVLSEQKIYKENILELNNNLLKLAETARLSNNKALDITQVLFEDYVVQIASLTGVSQTEMGNRLIKKIGIPLNQMFVVK